LTANNCETTARINRQGAKGAKKGAGRGATSGFWLLTSDFWRSWRPGMNRSGFNAAFITDANTFDAGVKWL
jgi:hypothetical protein